MCAATLPAADYIVPLGDEISGAPEVEIGERFAEIGHECLDVLAATARLVQRVLKKHFRSGKLVDDVEGAGLGPEIGGPTDQHGLVVLFFCQCEILLYSCLEIGK